MTHTLTRLVDFLSDHDNECGARTPTWRCTGTILAVASAVAIFASGAHWTLLPVDLHVTDPIVRVLINCVIVLIVGATVHGILGWSLSPKHYHCDQCSRCSTSLGVPACRRSREALDELRLHGWYVGRGDRQYCPDHFRFATQS